MSEKKPLILGNPSACCIYCGTMAKPKTLPPAVPGGPEIVVYIPLDDCCIERVQQAFMGASRSYEQAREQNNKARMNELDPELERLRSLHRRMLAIENGNLIPMSAPRAPYPQDEEEYI